MKKVLLIVSFLFLLLLNMQIKRGLVIALEENTAHHWRSQMLIWQEQLSKRLRK